MRCLPFKPWLSCWVVMWSVGLCVFLCVSVNALCAHMFKLIGGFFRWNCWINSRWKEARRTRSAGSFHSYQVRVNKHKMSLRPFLFTYPHHTHPHTSGLFEMNREKDFISNLETSRKMPNICCFFQPLRFKDWLLSPVSVWGFWLFLG